MKKGLLILIVIVLMASSFVAGAVLTKNEFMQRYPNDVLIKDFQRCGAIVENGKVILEDIDCIKERSVKQTCIVYAETTAIVNGEEVKFQKEFCQG